MRTKNAEERKPDLSRYKASHSYWYGFNHVAVAKQLGGDLSFCNEFCVNGEYSPVAVYRAAKPDKSKGHKEFVLLQTQPAGGGLIRGMSPAQIKPFSRQAGVWCQGCDEAIYSIMRHNMQTCRCKDVSVDGGQDYFKVSSRPGAVFKLVEINLLTSEVKVLKEKRTRARR